MLISLSLLLPALGATLIGLAALLSTTRREPARRLVAVIAPVVVVPAIMAATTAAGATLEVPWLMFGITLSVDDVARPLLLVSALLYGAALIWSAWTTRDYRSTGGLSAFLLACYTGNIGVYLAADAVSFYLFFAIMSFSAAGLIFHYRTLRSYRATRIYLVMTVISETALLAGLFFTVQAGGSTLTEAPDAILAAPQTGLILSLFLIAFGIKAGMVPLHMWLPVAYSASPPVAAAVLSGAMSKAGLVGMLRFFPLDTSQPAADVEPAVGAFGWVVMALALIGMFGAVIVGVLQRNALTVLAYSSISQMGFMTAVVAAGLINSDMAQDALDSTVLYAVHHGLAKAALFIGVGAMQRYGYGIHRILVVIGMVSAGLALVGAPLTSGGISKYVSKEAVGTLSVVGIGLEYILPLVATGSTLLLLRLLWLERSAHPDTDRQLDAQLPVWLILCVAGVVVPWLVGTQWSPLELPDFTDPTTLWDASWPVGAGLAIGAILWWLVQRGSLTDSQTVTPAIPPGDLIVGAERVADIVQTDGAVKLDTIHDATTRYRTNTHSVVAELGRRTRQGLNRLDDKLGAWPRFGTVGVVLLTLVLVVSLIVSGGA